MLGNLKMSEPGQLNCDCFIHFHLPTVDLKITPVCNPTLQVITLQISCMEKAGVAVDALQLYLGLKY